MSRHYTGVPCPRCKTPLDCCQDTKNPVQVPARCHSCGRAEVLELIDPGSLPGTPALTDQPAPHGAVGFLVLHTDHRVARHRFNNDDPTAAELESGADVGRFLRAAAASGATDERTTK